jgi:hypothetical protein
MVDLATALTHHLQYNHYPPVPVTLVPVCLWAINEPDLLARYPGVEGATLVRDGEPWNPTAAEVIEAFHLGEFIDLDSEME